MSKEYIEKLERGNISLAKKLKTDLLLQDIEICQTVIDSAGEPGLIEMFKGRRDKAIKELNKLDYGVAGLKKNLENYLNNIGGWNDKERSHNS